MAIYHLEAKIISRGSGRSAVAAAAYHTTWGGCLYRAFCFFTSRQIADFCVAASASNTFIILSAAVAVVSCLK